MERKVRDSFGWGIAGGTIDVQNAMTTIGQTITGDVGITGNSTVSGNITAGTIGVGDINITADGTITSDSNGDIVVSPGGTGSVIASGLRIKGTSISADDSDGGIICYFGA